MVAFLEVTINFHTAGLSIDARREYALGIVGQNVGEPTEGTIGAKEDWRGH